jgi:hypothetical protein
LSRPVPRLMAALLLGAGCGDGSGPRTAIVDCDAVPPTRLLPGQMELADASEVACVRLEASTAAERYLYLAFSAAGTESREGTSAPYRLSGAGEAPPPAAGRSGQPPAVTAPAEALHTRLRSLGRDLARGGTGSALRAVPAVHQAPPVVGEERTFNVLRSAEVPGTDQDDYVQVVATARYVGTHAAIFLDDAVPTAGGYTQDDLDAIGSLFDEHIHPIGVAAFGAESDINGDGVVLVLLSDRITRLAGCGGGNVVVGLFFAVDLLPNLVGSNQAEIFYGLAPDESCGVDRDDAVSRLPTVFIHEFEHMINYGQKVLQRGSDAEDTWLDEGLASFAEELGGRLVPDERCEGNDCLTQFHRNNLVNAYRYLARQDESYLIGPRRPPLPLAQYGATWLFVRWLADHFSSEPATGTDLTRALVQTSRTGAANVEAATDLPLDRLIGEWQLANYLDDHPDLGGLTDDSRLTYTTWNLRELFGSFHDQDPQTFPDPYPLAAGVIGGDFDLSGVLRPGSGRHLELELAPLEVMTLLLADPGGEAGLPAAVAPRTLVLRLR